MPSTHTIPERNESRCAPCQYHKRTDAFYGHDHSWHRYACTHPKAFDDLDTPTDDERIKRIRAEIHARMTEGGRDIGKTERQPQWCPLLR